MKSISPEKICYIFLVSFLIIFFAVMRYTNSLANKNISTLKKGMSAIEQGQSQLRDKLDYQDYKTKEIIKLRDRIDEQVKNIRSQLRKPN